MLCSARATASPLLTSLPHPPNKEYKHTQNAPCTYLPVCLGIKPPVFKQGHLGIARIRLKALRNRTPRCRGCGFAQQRLLSVEGLCCVEGGEAETEGEGEEGTGSWEEEE